MAPVLPAPCFSDGVPADGGPRSGEAHTSAFAHVGVPRGGGDGAPARATAAAIVFSPDGAGEGLALDSSSADTPLCGCGGQSFAEPAGSVCHGGHPSAGFVSLSPSASADAGADARGEQEGRTLAAAAGSTGLCRESSCFASPTRATSIVSLGSMDGSIGDVLTFAQACPQEERWRAEYLPVVAHIVQRVGRGLRDRRRVYAAFVRSVVEEDGAAAAAAAAQPKHLHFKEMCEASSRSWRERRLRCGGAGGGGGGGEMNKNRGGGSHGAGKCHEASSECVGGSGERCASASPTMMVFSLSAADRAKPKLD
eukprot:Rhum_TRINITY_DN14020_c1_g2::Rhum_TRINITY_DN14020_c1_g2_i1::g.67574::m.67574